MRDCETVYQGVPYFLARDEQAQVRLLCQHVIKSSCNQVLVSGAAGQRMYSVGFTEIAARFGEQWSIEAIKYPTEVNLESFLRDFAQDIQSDITRPRIRFVATAPRYLSAFLSKLEARCSLGLFLMGFDARNQEQYTKECIALLTSWSRCVGQAAFHVEGIVDTGDNDFLFDTRRSLRRSMDAGETPTDLFLAALELRDG